VVNKKLSFQPLVCRTAYVHGVPTTFLSTILLVKATPTKAEHGNIQFLPLTLYHKNKMIKNYWLTNILQFDNEDMVNYQLSSVYLEGTGYNEYTKLNLNNYEEHLLERRKDRDTSLEGYRPIYIHDLIFKSEISKNIITINFIKNGVAGYYVSEKLKNEIEEAGCIGIEFEAVEQG